MIEKNIEEMCINFLEKIYTYTPINILQGWGMERFSRFKTKIWKHLEESCNMEGFLSRYFEFFPKAPIEVIEVLENLDDISKKEIFLFLKNNLIIIIGRMQLRLKKAKEMQKTEVEETKSEKKKTKKEKKDDETGFLWSV